MTLTTKPAAEAAPAVPQMEKTTLGDVNEDGYVNIEDVTTLIDFLLGATPSPFNTTAADVDSNGNINVADVTALIDLILAK